MIPNEFEERVESSRGALRVLGGMLFFGEGTNAEEESKVLNKRGEPDEEVVDNTTDDDEKKYEEEVIEGKEKIFLFFFTSSAHTFHLAFSVFGEIKKAKPLQRKSRKIETEGRDSYPQ